MSQQPLPTTEPGSSSVWDKSPKFSEKPSLEELRQTLADFTAARDWNKFHKPRNLVMALMGEVGELAELFMWKEDCPVGLPDWSEKDKQHLGQEISDCLIYLIRLATVCHVDLPAAVVAKIAENDRKYPVEKAFGRTTKYNEL